MTPRWGSAVRARLLQANLTALLSHHTWIGGLLREAAVPGSLDSGRSKTEAAPAPGGTAQAGTQCPARS